MGGAFWQWVEKKGLEKYFRRDNLIILILAGILLFVIALPVNSGGRRESGGGTSKNPTAQSGSAAENSMAGGRQEGPGNISFEAEEEKYAAELEARLTEVLSEMDATGKVKVMITLKSSEELVVERETSVTGSSTEETDAQGGSRRIESRDMEERVVYGTAEDGNQPYVIKSYAPRIEGVLVVAQGAGTGTVNRTVTEIVQALFGIEAHKVKVVKMRD